MYELYAYVYDTTNTGLKPSRDRAIPVLKGGFPQSFVFETRTYRMHDNNIKNVVTFSVTITVNKIWYRQTFSITRCAGNARNLQSFVFALIIYELSL